MSTDPTQPMSPSAPAGSGRPQEREPRERDGRRPEAGAADQTAAGRPADSAAAAQRDPPQSPAVPPTRVQPAAEQVAPTRVQPSFQPAQPSFQPAPRPPQPSFQPAQPAKPAQPAEPPSEAAGRPSESGQASRERPTQVGWPEQPPLNSPQPGGTRRGRGGENAYPGAPAPRRRRRWVIALFGLIVLLILLTIGDRVALAVAENQFADQAVKNGMPVKPSVTIEGFPFLTQLVARDFRRVDISANNVPAGPVNITSVKATLNGMHLNSSFNGATVDHITATGFVSFSELASVGNVAGLTMTADGPDKVKITAGFGPLSDTEEAKIAQTGPQTISVQVLPSGSPLSSFGSFSFNIPKLPAQVRITSLSVTPKGLTLTAAADHANLSKPSS
ncbi:MAG TPA: LmeA family phospholipid-binding protein [Streptosporangiaceae bacterium]